MLVQVTSGTIIHDGVKYAPGESFHVSEDRAQRFEQLKVAIIIGKPSQEDQPVFVKSEPVETTCTKLEASEQSAGPVMTVDDAPFEKQKKKKRGRRKG